MRSLSALLAALVAAEAVGAETVLGVYIFSRHGDRTAKATAPANLTDLGYLEVYTSGTYYRNRYIAANASFPIFGMNTDIVAESQITAAAPSDTVIQNSAAGWLQGLYPPVGSSLGSNTLRNGSVVYSPLNGYQLIALEHVDSGADLENAGWLQGSSTCLNAKLSSNNYFSSDEYIATYNRTYDLYQSLLPMINGSFSSSAATFKNAYTIWDLLNVASIHNSSDEFRNSEMLTPELYTELKNLAAEHEWGLAYNESEPIRAVSGMTLAADVLEGLNGTITGKGKNKLNVQFGAYATMLSYFGLAQLPAASTDFYGLPGYATTLTWELVTNATVSSGSFPSTDDISVRFLFANGTASPSNPLVEFPLFGQSVSPLPWSDFVSATNEFSLNDHWAWCKACGNSTGVCSAEILGTSTETDNSSSTASASSSETKKGGISTVVAGVIGAMVTLGVILGLELLVILLAGLRLVKKNRLASPVSSASGEASSNPLKAA
ncbi:hypothetical protein DV735_g1462, partial [Chaetothyriales sp. CBS 134920]